jgi:hypothetical protein
MPLSDADSCRLVSSLPSREREPAMPFGTLDGGEGHLQAGDQQPGVVGQELDHLRGAGAQLGVLLPAGLQQAPSEAGGKFMFNNSTTNNSRRWMGIQLATVVFRHLSTLRDASCDVVNQM